MCKDTARMASILSDEEPEVRSDAEPEVHSDTEPEVLTPPTLVITSGEGGRKQCDFEDIST